MREFNYSYPIRVHFGCGIALSAIEKEADKMGPTIMLAYGGGAIKRNGIYDDIKNLLEKKGKRVVDFPGIMSNPTYKKVKEGASLAKKEGGSFILAVGGGSVIDCAKVIAVQAKTGQLPRLTLTR